MTEHLPSQFKLQANPAHLDHKAEGARVRQRQLLRDERRPGFRAVAFKGLEQVTVQR